MQKFLPMSCLTLPLLFVGFANANQVEPKDEPKQQWIIQVDDDLAVISATPNTQAATIQRTIRLLQRKGLKRFALRTSDKPGVVPNQGWSISISLRDGEAELDPSRDTPYEYIVAIIETLAHHNGARKIKFLQNRSDRKVVVPESQK